MHTEVADRYSAAPKSLSQSLPKPSVRGPSHERHLIFCTPSIDPNIVFLCHYFLDVSQDSQLQVKETQLGLFFLSFFLFFKLMKGVGQLM